MKKFSGGNTFGFTIQDVVRDFQETNRFHLARILVNIVDKDILCKYTGTPKSITFQTLRSLIIDS